ncbi:carbamoyl phosphate synthase small subunit [Lacticaseibacillus absianus]|uniref:carbamoyl phosphate synthase small subunit n=1 Tax=Lacticaseibacillus absianus TaxID=2729623 RepID=UPI0015CE5613|nr:carbamoyl phosphate synthase small subunit [Lacticaseibacillus absianus]
MAKFLYLEDGTQFTGTAFGAPGVGVGELVFNTSMVGYQEALTDPSYADQLLTFTYPLIGTYGVDPRRDQGPRAVCQAAIVHTLENEPGPTGETLAQFLTTQGVPGIAGIDTRALTKHIRTCATMKALLLDAPLTASFDSTYAALHSQRHKWPTPVAATMKAPHATHHVVVLDFGAKAGIEAQLLAHGCDVTVVAPQCSLAAIVALQPDGLLLSNGPGDPTDYAACLPLIRALQARYPLAGICLGHQLLALANGAQTQPMKFGHRGINHPVTLLDSGRTIITSQNHGYTVMPSSLAGTDLVVTAVEGNDGTIEGLALRHLPAFSVQFHPEAQPGPEDATGFFTRFNQLMQEKVTRYA